MLFIFPRFFLISLFFFQPAHLFAQQEKSRSEEVIASDQPEGEPELLYQKRNQPRVDMESLRKEFEPAPKEIEVARHLSLEHWSRFTGGLWFSYGNVGITRPMFKITTDELLMKNATERVWGFGGQLDFAIAGSLDQSLRTRVGILRSTISPQSAISAKHSNASFETQSNILHLSAIQRWQLMATEETGQLWGGVGGQMNYALSSTRNNSGGSPRSNLSNSYAFNLIFAAGTDIAITDLEDVSLEFQYLPPRALVFLIGFRSSL